MCLKEKNIQKAMFYWNAKITKCKYQKQSIRNKIKKFVVGAYLSRKKKSVYIIPNMNCYSRNGQLRYSDFTRHKLYHHNHYQYSQHPILWVVLNISTIVLRTRLIRVQSQHPTKQVELTIHSKISLVKDSDNIKYKTQFKSEIHRPASNSEVH